MHLTMEGEEFGFSIWMEEANTMELKFGDNILKC